MKVYCVKFLNECDDIVDVDHIIADSEDDLRVRCDEIISFAEYKGINKIYSMYMFHEVDLKGYKLVKESE